jgi:hypothetical protein
VLLVAALSTIRNRSSYSELVRAYRVMPDWLATAFARVLHPVEIGLGVALLTTHREVIVVAAPVAGLLFCGYAAGLAINVARGRTNLDCGCFAFGAQSEKRGIGWWHVVRATSLAGVSAVVTVAALRDVAVAHPIAGVLVSAGIAAVAVVSIELRLVIRRGASSLDTYLAAARTEMSRGLR